MKYVLSFVALMIFSGTAFAGPYVEYKNELKFSDKTHLDDETVNHLRFGYQMGDRKKNIYVEAGPRTDGGLAKVVINLRKDLLV